MGPVEDPKEAVVLSRLSESTKAISELTECRNVCKKMYGNLVRRAKLLSPLFEELRDSEEELGEEEVKAFESLRLAVDSAMLLLASVNRESKLYLVTSSLFFLLFSCFLIFCLVAEKKKKQKKGIENVFWLLKNVKLNFNCKTKSGF
jgi:uncharacterized protein YhaN